MHGRFTRHKTTPTTCHNGLNYRCQPEGTAHLLTAAREPQVRNALEVHHLTLSHRGGEQQQKPRARNALEVYHLTLSHRGGQQQQKHEPAMPLRSAILHCPTAIECKWAMGCGPLVGTHHTPYFITSIGLQDANTVSICQRVHKFTWMVCTESSCRIRRQSSSISSLEFKNQ